MRGCSTRIARPVQWRLPRLLHCTAPGCLLQCPQAATDPSRAHLQLLGNQELLLLLQLDGRAQRGHLRSQRGQQAAGQQLGADKGAHLACAGRSAVLA